ncbi:MAG: ankyrin repeat domain-containing protein [Candidatus Hydrogenedentes bacterium]|nr:ankyrin repeat domain-containing protein [Candidatus Hydrogenedentota bacterium]
MIIVTVLGFFAFIFRPSIPSRYKALIKAVEAGDVVQITALLERGLDPNFRPRRPFFDTSSPWDKYLAPLHLAAEAGNEHVSRILLLHGAKPNLRASLAGDAPLDIVVQSVCGFREMGTPVPRGYIETARVLIDAGADPQYMSSKGDTALKQAATCGPPELLEQLLRLRYGEHAFLVGLGGAATAENQATFELLMVRAGEDVLVRSLQSAAKTGHVVLLKMLLDHGVNPNRLSAGCGSTPLHAAAQRGDVESVRLLLAHGAQKSSEDASGRVPLDLTTDPLLVELLSGTCGGEPPSK